ncbi:MAG: DUF6273 domain-containing protein [Lachnospiraceae bacterium]|nr:DUF6273 domain-containing protein [Lachnospiraceae bacterium]
MGLSACGSSNGSESGEIGFSEFLAQEEAKEELIEEGEANPPHLDRDDQEVFGSIEGAGEIISLGQYEQDSDSSNGAEAIEWIVLTREGDKALVTSKYVLDCHKFNSEQTDVTWEDCSLRYWLNGEFASTAFSAEERARIQTRTVVNDDNTEYKNSFGGNDTEDGIFLLSLNEAKMYFSENEARMCPPTAYALSQGAVLSNVFSPSGEGTRWWLRSPGFDNGSASYVNIDGTIDHHGFIVRTGDCGVRPAMWIQM